jgi:tetratricopeptide (TPR) repeat protein
MTQCYGLLYLICLTCQEPVPLGETAPVEAAEPLGETAPVESAERLWDMGQDAMRQGQLDKAIELYQRSLKADPDLTRNYLSLAAAYLQQGDDASACAHLARYVAANPDQLLMRVHLADLFLRLQQVPDAIAEYGRCIAHAQERDDPGGQHLIHCHTQLMAIAESTDDSYGEHLHRGIGLYHLGVQRALLAETGDELPSQALLCKAAGELTLARVLRPDEARPLWYLHEVWSRLAQRQLAVRALRAASAAAPFTYLTAAEQRSLDLACQCEHLQAPAK